MTLEHCQCCRSTLTRYGQARVLGKYDVSDYRCTSCGFIRSETPFWLEEAYSAPMVSYDLGGLSRPALNSAITKALICLCFNQGGRFLDYGGGYGIFTRWMRDIGYDFWHHDKHSQNLFATAFEADVSRAVRYELVTAFEVFEHVDDAAALLDTLFSLSDSIFFSTEVLPNPTPRLEDWWYFGPEHGQHVSFYTSDALSRLASSHRVHYHYVNSFHLFTKRPLHNARFKLAFHRSTRAIINWINRRESLLMKDFDQLRQQSLHHTSDSGGRTITGGTGQTATKANCRVDRRTHRQCPYK